MGTLAVLFNVAAVSATFGETLAYRNVGAGVAIPAAESTPLLADDLVPAAAFGCPLDRYSLTVTGDAADPSGGSEPFQVEVGLYEFCPGAQPGQRLIASTNATFDFPAGGVHDVVVQIPEEMEVPLPGTVYLRVDFDRAGCGVIGGAPTEVGFSDDRFHSPDDPCSADLGGYPASPHASFAAEVYVRGACDPIHAVYRNSQQSLHNQLRGGSSNAFWIDDVIPSETDCVLYGAETLVYNIAFYRFFLGEFPFEELSWVFFNNMTSGRILSRTVFDTPVPTSAIRYFWATLNSTTAAFVAAPGTPTLGASVPGTGFRDGFGDITERTFTQGLDLTLFCVGDAPIGACCDGYWRDGFGAPTCREVPRHACANPSNWREGVTCAEAEQDGCLLGACCVPDFSCSTTSESDCLASDPNAFFTIGASCGDPLACPALACGSIPRDCSEANALCENESCCTLVCAEAGLDHCCTSAWTSVCDDAAQNLCPALLDNDECATPAPFGGATRIGLGELIEIDLLESTGSADDPLLCCDLADSSAEPEASRWVVFRETSERTPRPISMSVCALDEADDVTSLRVQFFRVAEGAAGTCADGSACTFRGSACADGSFCEPNLKAACASLERVGCSATSTGPCENGLPGWDFCLRDPLPGEPLFVQVSSADAVSSPRVSVEHKRFCRISPSYDETIDCDFDGLPDVCELPPFAIDWDEDGALNDCDNCPDDFNPEQYDFDGDGFGNECDICPYVRDYDQADSDGDGIGDACDNCRDVFNPGQETCTRFGAGDACVDPESNHCTASSDFEHCLDCNANGRFDVCEVLDDFVAVWGPPQPDPQFSERTFELSPDGQLMLARADETVRIVERTENGWDTSETITLERAYRGGAITSAFLAVVELDGATGAHELVIYERPAAGTPYAVVHRQNEMTELGDGRIAILDAHDDGVAYAVIGDATAHALFLRRDTSGWAAEPVFSFDPAELQGVQLGEAGLWRVSEDRVQVYTHAAGEWTLTGDEPFPYDVAITLVVVRADSTLESVLGPFSGHVPTSRTDEAQFLVASFDAAKGSIALSSTVSLAELLEVFPVPTTFSHLGVTRDRLVVGAATAFLYFNNDDPDALLFFVHADGEWVLESASKVSSNPGFQRELSLELCRESEQNVFCRLYFSPLHVEFRPGMAGPYSFDLIPDDCQTDEDQDGVPQEVDNCPDHPNPEQFDCDFDGVGDVCAIAEGFENDCDGNGIPDNCEEDCNGNRVRDLCEPDCDGDQIPDDCELDCNENGTPDDCEPIDDCDGNGIPDSCDVRAGLVRFSPADPASAELFGMSVDISGNRVIIADPSTEVMFDDIEPECSRGGPTTPLTGATWLVEFDGANWDTLFTRLRNTGAFKDYAAVAIDRDRAFFGEVLYTEAGNWTCGGDVVSLFTRFEFGRVIDLGGRILVGGGWGTDIDYMDVSVDPVSQHTARVPSNDSKRRFGVGVGTDGLRFIVGQQHAEDISDQTGAAFVYEPVFPVVQQPLSPQQELRSPDGCAVDEFGIAVDVFGNTAVVGAPGSGCDGRRGGAVHVFKQLDGLWTHSQTLQAPLAEADDRFGFALDLEGERLLIGAPGRGIGGRALLFERVNGAFRFQREYGPDDLLDGANFGQSVALSRSLFVVGAPGRGGAAYAGHIDGGDCDLDDVSDRCAVGNVDGVVGFGTADFLRFFDCASGPCDTLACGETGFDRSCCATIDADRDGDRDLRDLAVLMLDSDGDGVGDVADNCPDVANSEQLDSDGDAVGDVCDACPTEETGQDADGDGVCDPVDLCPGGDDRRDADSDGTPDFCDPCPSGPQVDADGDGTCDTEDLCPGFDDRLDVDADGVPDACDECAFDSDNDLDADGVCGDEDNCPNDTNDTQLDTDSDGAGDVCDVCPFDALDDLDGDGVCGDVDVCPGFDDAVDADGDGVPDACDRCPSSPHDDSDGDFVCDDVDACPDTPLGAFVNTAGCSLPSPAHFDSSRTLDELPGPTRSFIAPDRYDFDIDGVLQRIVVDINGEALAAQNAGTLDSVAAEVPVGEVVELLSISNVFGDPLGSIVQTAEIRDMRFGRTEGGLVLLIDYTFTERFVIGGTDVTNSEWHVDGFVRFVADTNLTSMDFQSAEGSIEQCTFGSCTTVPLTIEFLGGVFGFELAN